MNGESISMLLFILAVYFVPWAVAASRDHHQRGAIAVLNLFLGWTGLGWVIALVWACAAVRKDHHA